MHVRERAVADVARGITCSMSRRGNCSDSALMERFFSTVKFELGEHFESCGEAKIQVFDYIEGFHNQRRRHSTLGQISPAAFERRTAAAWITTGRSTAATHHLQTLTRLQDHLHRWDTLFR
jgi:transposase InsO family protein